MTQDTTPHTEEFTYIYTLMPSHMARAIEGLTKIFTETATVIIYILIEIMQIHLPTKPLF